VTFESGCNIRFLGEFAFAFCEWLRSICIPASVATIAASCFARCRYLLDLTFEVDGDLLVIREHAFQDCSSLRSIRIPASVERIDQGCFDGCGNLSRIEVEAGSRLSAQSLSYLRSICKVVSDKKPIKLTLYGQLDLPTGLSLLLNGGREIALFSDGGQSRDLCVTGANARPVQTGYILRSRAGHYLKTGWIFTVSKPWACPQLMIGQ
jgi:hypothetical protein